MFGESIQDAGGTVVEGGRRDRGEKVSTDVGEDLLKS